MINSLRAHIVRSTVMSSAAAVSWMGSTHVIAQSLPGAEDLAWIPYVEKGGGWVVLLVVLWVYRRDYRRLSDGETQRVDQLIALHEKSAKATQDIAVAISHNTEVLRAVTTEIRKCAGNNHDMQGLNVQRDS